MKLILFSRCELVQLYGSMDKYLKNKVEVIHLSYSNKEQEQLLSEYGIESECFSNEIDLTCLNEELTYFIERLDDEINLLTEGRFNINRAIQSDRTLKDMPYKDCLKLVASYASYWDRYFKEKPGSVIFHEPTSLMLNHLAYIYCKKYGGKYISPILVKGQYENSFIFTSGDDAKLVLGEQLYSQEGAEKFLEEFIQDYTTLGQEMVQKSSISGVLKKFIFKSLKYFLGSFKALFNNKKTVTKYIEDYHFKSIRPLRYLLSSLYERWFVDYSEVNLSDKYYYYPMHVEPEAVVEYWGDGLYSHQIKLIENIAASLPAGAYLYVKTHPHDKEPRLPSDYKRLTSIPNVKLMHKTLSGKEIVSNSQGVITINGTSGFEGALLGKRVYTFGNTWYSNLTGVTFVKDIRMLPSLLKEPEIERGDLDDLRLFLGSCHEGYVNYFVGLQFKKNIDLDINAKKVAESLLATFNAELSS